MRVSVSHNKTREEAIRKVDQAVDRLLEISMDHRVAVTDVQRDWAGSTMNFTLKAGVGPVRVPVKGIVDVHETEVVVEVHLPWAVRRVLPERTVATSLESRLRALLG